MARTANASVRWREQTSAAAGQIHPHLYLRSLPSRAVEVSEVVMLMSMVDAARVFPHSHFYSSFQTYPAFLSPRHYFYLQFPRWAYQHSAYSRMVSQLSPLASSDVHNGLRHRILRLDGRENQMSEMCYRSW